jgi:GTP-binding protein
MDIRNVCIIAHVDHGKTTLVDHLLQQSGTFAAHREVEERVMDSMDLERERGITILSKNTSIRVGDIKVNVIDTPGHADFGGEVERIMSMAQGAILLVDAAEGPLPQTRFVLEKAIKQGLKIILVINKVDRNEVQGTNRIDEVVDETFDLFCELGASEEQTDFPIVYACARGGWCTLDSSTVPALIEDKGDASLEPLFNLIVSTIKPPEVTSGSFKMLVSNLDYSDFVGQTAVGSPLCGEVKKNDRLYLNGVDENNRPVKKAFSVTKVFSFQGLRQIEVESLQAGDIGLIAGYENVNIGDTLCADEKADPLPRINVEQPTLAMIFSINTSPLSGLEGEAVQSRKLRERLLKAARYNVALRFEDTDSSDQFRLLGRGELQFSILIEQMRREGLEFMVGRPQVLIKTDEATGEKQEPMENAVVDLPETASGEVTEMFQTRKGIMTSYESLEGNRVRLKFEIPTRGLLGIQSKLLTATRGEGLLSSELSGYAAFKGDLSHRINGALISDRAGDTVEYALSSLEERGQLFISSGVKVYEGMIIGECAKDNDLNVNPCKEKKLTNVRASGSDGLVVLNGIRKMSLENCIEWIDDDEWIEVTPENIRLRKKVLGKNLRNVRRK